MPLVDLTSDLTSLKYGRDRRGGGWSGQPYFRQDPPSRVRSINFGNSFLGNDFLIRGGVRAVSAVLEDEIRLTNFLTNLRSPNGLLFISKQELLSKQAPLTGAGPDRIYNPLNTLAQVGVNNVGIHFMKQGKTLRIDDNDTYFKKTQNQYNTNTLGTENKNKMLLLYETNIVTPTVYNPSIGTQEQSITALLNNLEDNSLLISQFNSNLGIFGISPTPELLFQYQGGPNAPLGQKTSVRKVFNTNDAINNNKLPDTTNQLLVYTQDLLKGRSRSTTTGFSNVGISNFETIFTDSRTKTETGVQDDRIKKLIGIPTDYTQFNRSSTYGEGNPGSSGRDKSLYYTTPISGQSKPDSNIYQVDSVNAQPLYSSRDGSAKSGKGFDDIVKFNIGVIDLNSTPPEGTPRDTTWLHFRASITNFEDAYNADWQSFKYMGRGNDFYKYTGFRRSISMGFEVVVYSKYEQAFVYDKLNYLASVITPNYSNGGFMRGNLIKLTVGDYLNNTIGILNSINYSIPEDSPWDIGRDIEGGDDSNSLQLPQRITVGNFAFTPIHDFLEKSVTSDYAKGIKPTPDSPYISLGNEHRGYEFTHASRQSLNT